MQHQYALNAKENPLIWDSYGTDSVSGQQGWAKLVLIALERYSVALKH
jgi:hypothetical protein